jgi:hypothetical protein
MAQGSLCGFEVKSSADLIAVQGRRGFISYAAGAVGAGRNSCHDAAQEQSGIL